MKNPISMALLATVLLCCPLSMDAQFLKKLGKRAQKAAERTVERRVETETSKKTDEVLDSILEPGAKEDPGMGPSGTGDNSGNPSSPGTPAGSDGNPGGDVPASIAIYSKFDFVPGDKPLFSDNFSDEFVGDFPSKWNTNGSGEVVTLGTDPAKWLTIKAGHAVYYVPDVPRLPEEYTIEFDMLATGLDRQTASTAVLRIILSNDRKFNLGSYGLAQLSFCQYAPVAFRVRNSTGDINNEISADIRDALQHKVHVSIAVNKQRFRLWLNEKKYIDVPRLLPSSPRPDGLKFELLYFNEGREKLMLTNFNVAEGGLDLRRKLLEEGSVSTNGILFESGSARLQPQSMGIIRQIYQVLQQDPGIKLRIVGHTDSDGDEASNLTLSRQRAEAVKNALVTVFKSDPARLTTEGKGESQPVADNKTQEGKSRNRRVEFIRI